MRESKEWRNLLRQRQVFFDSRSCRLGMKPFLGFITIMLYIVYRTTNFQYLQTELDSKLYRFYTSKESVAASTSLKGLPRGIIEDKSDFELKPLWSTSSSQLKLYNDSTLHNLLAIPVGLKQKRNVNTIVQKFLQDNFTIILFHYDGKMDGWRDLEWSNEAIHIVAQNQTKWWFAKRFLHPASVSIYDYIFLWDEDLGVQHFNPRRYLDIVKAEVLEISQPALDPNSTGIHHRITVRKRTNKFHRRIYDSRGSVKCSDASDGPPCAGFVEGMAPVFSRAAWHCAWHLIQNDLVHGWGMDIKLGYCAQGDRSKKVGIVDREYVVHQGIQSLGGPSAKKTLNDSELKKKHTVDMRSEIRRQSTMELKMFKQRWEKAAKEDRNWVDPYFRRKRRREQRPTESLDTWKALCLLNGHHGFGCREGGCPGSGSKLIIMQVKV